MISNRLLRKLQAGETTFGMWVTLESPNVTEVAVALGLDWIVVEMEHGHLDWRDVVGHLRVTKGTATTALVRVTECGQGTIKRALDIGAQGIVVPMIGSVDDLERAISFGSYPPRGVRGVGGERCVQWGLQAAEYLPTANDETLIIPLLESRNAFENIDHILTVDGLKTVFFGPADLSASYGYLGQWEGPGIEDKLLLMQAKAATLGISSGILARDGQELLTRREQGFRMIGIGADINLMIRSIQDVLAMVNRTRDL